MSQPAEHEERRSDLPIGEKLQYLIGVSLGPQLVKVPLDWPDRAREPSDLEELFDVERERVEHEVVAGQ